MVPPFKTTVFEEQQGMLLNFPNTIIFYNFLVNLLVNLVVQC